MKSCRKAPTEPGCLTELRGRQPDADWDTLRDARDESGASCYAALRDSLRRSQGCLCAYCEQRIESGNEQIAHFHPKSDVSSTHNWALDWDNLWLACKGGTRRVDRAAMIGPPYTLPENRSCDEATEDRDLDGKILRPDEVPAFPRVFGFRQWPNEIHIKPDAVACGQCRLSVAMVEATINHLHLNCRRLAEARLAHHRGLERKRAALRKSGHPDPKSELRRLAASLLGRDASGCHQGFFTLSRWALGGLAEAYLRESGSGHHIAPDPQVSDDYGD